MPHGAARSMGWPAGRVAVFGATPRVPLPGLRATDGGGRLGGSGLREQWRPQRQRPIDHRYVTAFPERPAVRIAGTGLVAALLGTAVRTAPVGSRRPVCEYTDGGWR